MRRIRVIPALLLEHTGLVKTVKFGKRTYLGDPINIIRIFNDKEVDEVALLDIAATPEGRTPNFDLIAKIASQCFMPLAYGGGVTKLEQVHQLLSIGVEKVILNTATATSPELITAAADAFGRQAIVGSVDVKQSWTGRYEVYTHCGTKATGKSPEAWCAELMRRGCGELLINSIDRDGTMKGYDVALLRSVCDAVSVPVIACGGAGKTDDFADAVIEGRASAVAAGSMFVFHGKHRAVLINYPSQTELARVFGKVQVEQQEAE